MFVPNEKKQKLDGPLFIDYIGEIDQDGSHCYTDSWMSVISFSSFTRKKDQCCIFIVILSLFSLFLMIFGYILKMKENGDQKKFFE